MNPPLLAAAAATGVCNLCNAGVNFMLDWDRAGAFRLAALQSAAGRALLQRSGRDPSDISSIVLVTPKRCVCLLWRRRGMPVWVGCVGVGVGVVGL